jgi:hypothetical protein
MLRCSNEALFTERHDENMPGSNGECGPEGLGDIDTKGRIDQVGIVLAIGESGFAMGSTQLMLLVGA